jgi:adenylate cyclase
MPDTGLTDLTSARTGTSQPPGPIAQPGAIEQAPTSRSGKIGLRSALAGLVLVTVGITALVIHLTWSYAARRNVAEVVGQLNLQIVGSVQHEIRDTLNDAWSVQEAVRSIFFQEAIKPTDEAKREFIFLALLRSHPTLSWIAIGFPNGGFFGALRAGDDEIDMVEVKRDPETGVRQQRVDTYMPQSGDVLFRGREITPSDFDATAQTWY